MSTPDLSSLFRTSDCSIPTQGNDIAAARAALAEPENQAMLIAQAFPVATLASLGKKTLGSLVTPAGFKAFRDDFLKEYGSPKNPLVVFMLDELLWAHFQVANLHALAAAAPSPELVALYSATAARLMGEVRKSALVLLAKPPQAAMANGAATQSSAEKKSSDSKLGTNEGPPENADQPNPNSASDRQPDEQDKAKRPVSGRQTAAA